MTSQRYPKQSIQPLVWTIAQAQSEAEIRRTVMTQVGLFFGATRWSLMLASDLPEITEDMPQLMRRAMSPEHNPVLRYLIQRHAAVHEGVVLPPGLWQTFCPRIDHGHVMLGPVLSQGALAGGIALTRHREATAFDAEDLADLNALSTHLSLRLEGLRLEGLRPEKQLETEQSRLNLNRSDTLGDRPPATLTARQRQIAGLVAQGMTNAEIGAALWITENSVKQALKRIFRRLKVTSRAQMVAQLMREETSPDVHCS